MSTFGDEALEAARRLWCGQLDQDRDKGDNELAGRDRRPSSARILCESSRHAAQRASDGNAPAIGTSRRRQNEHRSAVAAADSRVASSAMHDSQMWTPGPAISRRPSALGRRQARQRGTRCAKRRTGSQHKLQGHEGKIPKDYVVMPRGATTARSSAPDSFMRSLDIRSRWRIKCSAYPPAFGPG